MNNCDQQHKLDWLIRAAESINELRNDPSNKALEQKASDSLITAMIALIGDDPEREGLAMTPSRVRRSWSELYAGYNSDNTPEKILSPVFSETASEGHRLYDQIVLLRDIEFHSTCEHHMLPFSGVVHVGYIPADGKAVGVSKLARLVEHFSRRLQIQERMTSEIAYAIDDVLNPQGVAVVVEAKHLCMGCRGVRKPGSTMLTSMMLGAFRHDPSSRAEFFSSIGK